MLVTQKMAQRIYLQSHIIFISDFAGLFVDPFVYLGREICLRHRGIESLGAAALSHALIRSTTVGVCLLAFYEGHFKRIAFVIF